MVTGSAEKDNIDIEPTPRALWSHIFGDLRGLLCVESFVRGDDDRLYDRRVEYFDYPGDSDAAESWAIARSEEGREVYFCAHLLTDQRRIKENAAPILSLWADADRATWESASAVVQTSPGNSQVFVRLDREMAPEEAERLNHRLTDAMGADSGGWARTKLLRVPGTRNHKYPARPLVKIASLSPQSRISPIELDRLLPPVHSTNGTGERQTSADDPPVRLTGRALDMWHGRTSILKENGSVDRSRTLISIGRYLYEAGAERPVIVPALEERDRTLGFDKYTGRLGEYDRIVDELERGGRNGSWNGSGFPREDSEEAQDAPGGARAGDLPTHELTDVGNAFRFCDRFGERVRYCFPFKSFLIFDGKRWVRDPGGMAEKMAIEVARDIHHEAASAGDKKDQAKISRWAISSQSETRIAAMLKLTRPYLRIAPEELDSDPLLFNCANGTIDLRTGEIRPHCRDDYLTKLSPVRWDPDAQAERFERFLSEIFGGQQTLIDFTRRYAGSCASGLTKDRAFVILHGPGKNGKTTLLELLRGVMGDYARDTPIESIMQTKYEGVGNDIAALRGARFVTASESDKGKKLAVAKIKKLVGSDTMTARFLFQELFEFKPELKLWIATNHKPVIEETTQAIWDRVNLLPFDVRFEGDDEDDKLPEKLQAESSGVLAWIVRGCLEWQTDGLNPPPEIQAATDEYRAEMDPIRRFLDEECDRVPGVSVKFSEFWERWKVWAEAEEEDPGSTTAMGRRLREEGFKKEKVGSIFYSGLALKDRNV